MDNRALVIFTDVERVSPVVYLHGCGDQVPAWLNGLKQLMRRREGDKDYLIPGLHDLGMIFESTIDGGVQP